MKSNSNKLFYKIYLVGFFLTLALPILRWPIYFSPSNWSKTILFQIIFSILLFVFLCQTLWRKNAGIFNGLRKINVENAAFWLLLALFGAQLLATIFSLDSSHSFFGSPDRGGGFINYGFYLLFAIVAFLVIKENDWQKLWNWAIFIGSLVSIIAIVFWLIAPFNPLIETAGLLGATIGGPNTLALYLLLLVFPTLSFAVITKNRVKKSFYIAALLVLCIAMIFTSSKGAWLGLAAGLAYFLFLYPVRNSPPLGHSGAQSAGAISNEVYPNKSRKLIYLKLALIVVAGIAITALLFSPLPIKMDQSRLSAWQVSWKAFLNRPFLGYGPENFYIGFDRHYDPSLPRLQINPITADSWWDKAHNFALNLLVETGIVGFIPFILLFGFLIFGLYKLAHRQQTDNQIKIISHGLIAAFIAYFIDLIFNFENFSSYIIVFLLAGYSLSLITPKNQATEQIQSKPNFAASPLLGRASLAYFGWERFSAFLFKNRKIISGALFLLLVFFIWFFTIKPFYANIRLNKAAYLAGKGNCDQATAIMDNELKKRSIIDGYLSLRYINIIRTCTQFYPDKNAAYAQKIIKVLEENTKIMPFYTRNWLALAGFTNILALAEQDPKMKEELFEKSKTHLEKARQLSPSREEVMVEEINFRIFDKDHDGAKKISQSCINKYPNLSTCYWYLGLSQIYLGKDETEEGKKNMEKAQAIGHLQSVNVSFTLSQLALLYAEQKNYQQLEWTYEKLTEFYPMNPRYFAILANIYKDNKKEEKAKEALKEALGIQSCAESPNSNESLIENVLGLKRENPRYHYILYHLYTEIGDFEKARDQAQKYYDAFTAIPEVQSNPTLLAKAKTDLDALLAKAGTENDKALCDKYKPI